MPGHRKNMKKMPKKRSISTKKTTQKPTQKLSAFGKAFFEARREKGPNETFPFKGKQYSTVTADQVKAAGFKTLREYLNSRNPKPIKPGKPITKKQKAGGPFRKSATAVATKTKTSQAKKRDAKVAERAKRRKARTQKGKLFFSGLRQRANKRRDQRLGR